MDEAEIMRLSKQLGVSESEIKKRINEMLKAVSKPTLKNIDCPLNNSYVGSSDKII